MRVVWLRAPFGLPAKLPLLPFTNRIAQRADHGWVDAMNLRSLWG